MPASHVNCGDVEGSVRLQLSPVFLASKSLKSIHYWSECKLLKYVLPLFTVPMTQEVSSCQVRSKGLESVSEEDL